MKAHQILNTSPSDAVLAAFIGETEAEVKRRRKRSTDTKASAYKLDVSRWQLDELCKLHSDSKEALKIANDEPDDKEIAEALGESYHKVYMAHKRHKDDSTPAYPLLLNNYRIKKLAGLEK